jgi:hypothetical protein
VASRSRGDWELDIYRPGRSAERIKDPFRQAKKEKYALLDQLKGNSAVVQITSVREKRRVHHCIIVLKGLPSKQRAQWYL